MAVLKAGLALCGHWVSQTRMGRMSGSSGSRDWGDRVIKRVNKFVANVCLGLMAQCAMQSGFFIPLPLRTNTEVVKNTLETP